MCSVLIEFCLRTAQINLAYPAERSDESSASEWSEKGTNRRMTNTETSEKSVTFGEQGAHVAPEKTSSKKGATRKKGVPKAKKAANAPKPERGVKINKKGAKSDRKAAGPHSESKGARILEMIKRTKGATLAEIMKATDWQAHSIAGIPLDSRKEAWHQD
jgi:hypothetical protein